MLMTFSIQGLLGLFFKIDDPSFSDAMVYVMLLVVMSYLFFGELIFKNTLGKYLFGIEVVNARSMERASVGGFIVRGLIKIIWPLEGFVLLIASNKKRLGDMWGKTIVVNKEENKYKPLIRLAMGAACLLVAFFSFSNLMGLGVKNSDFYAAGADFLKERNIEVDGLTKEVNQNGEIVNFVVPITTDDENEYALLCLERVDGEWSVYHHELLTDHKGLQFNFETYSSLKKEYHDNGELRFVGAVIENEKEGTCKWFYENGQLKEQTVWHKNAPTGKILMYHANGQKSVEGQAVNGLKEGKAILWHENGQLSELLYYSNDKVEGEYLSYHENGQLYQKGIFKKGEKVGEWEEYDENGNQVE
jgi:uncharacterized RDD family membrane protein YckC